MTRTVSVKLFANLQEAAGQREVPIDVEEGATAADAVEALVERHPALREELFEDGKLREHVNVAADGLQVDDDDPVDDASELAVFPPVSGG